jgi:hypothetical protein
MIKTQVQFPDHLYAEAKRISSEYEMSFAEVVRRGIEKLAREYPPRRVSTEKWLPPKPRSLGAKQLTHEELKEAAQMTGFEEDLINATKLKNGKVKNAVKLKAAKDDLIRY